MKLPSTAVAIDVGNSTVKLAEFRMADAGQASSLLRLHRLSTRQPDTQALAEWLEPFTGVVFLIGVCQPAEAMLSEWIGRHRDDLKLRSIDWEDFPLRIAVEQPGRVGRDRLAAAVAAAALKTADRPAIVVDAGSAVTIDLVAAPGEFLGGAILPGWRAMTQALSAATDALPAISELPYDSPPLPLGTSTERALVSGLYWGTVGAIRELIDRLSRLCTASPEVFISGGDLNWLLPHLHDGRYVVRGEHELALRGVAIVARSVLLAESPAKPREPGRA
jgi:type III pantothenate kinase